MKAFAYSIVTVSYTGWDTRILSDVVGTAGIFVSTDSSTREHYNNTMLSQAEAQAGSLHFPQHHLFRCHRCGANYWKHVQKDSGKISFGTRFRAGDHKNEDPEASATSFADLQERITFNSSENAVSQVDW
ncbi:MAG TPA: hypothetical protein DCY03_13585 [Planctomycetaceae bacterium]|jgi:hypothetical protein|nr:hypothetical protein [Planctomycetaceae bacterium]|tara:strand:+ start:323 stop:712 length:390 start_codon:yes stop_codon:yes gene_type:complete